MSKPVTMHIGPLGSTIHVLRADAATVAELAAIDWSRHFRRVCLDPARGLITLADAVKAERYCVRRSRAVPRPRNAGDGPGDVNGPIL